MKTIAKHLIERAAKTPYSHLEGYMNRYWLVPFSDSAAGVGCGPVNPLRRPLAWLFQKFGIAIRVHHILRPDNDRHFHDHPWNFCSVVLRGFYIERRPRSQSQSPVVDDTEWRELLRTPGDVMFRKSTDRHRIVFAREAWTLFITTRYRHSWGFYTSNGKVWWKDYLRVPHF